jgi:hypothetical protein
MLKVTSFTTVVIAPTKMPLDATFIRFSGFDYPGILLGDEWQVAKLAHRAGGVNHCRIPLGTARTDQVIIVPCAGLTPDGVSGDCAQGAVALSIYWGPLDPACYTSLLKQTGILAS